MRQNKQAQSGNVFLIILIGVVLFAALAMTISRSMRSESTAALSGREAALAAADILSYAQKLERSVSRLRRKGVSENEISFNNNFVSGYAHGQPDSHKIFSPAGGLVTWQSPAPGVNDASPWHFTGSTCIPDIGTGSAGCGSDGTSNEELIAVLPNVNQTQCEKINDQLDISGIPPDSGGGYSSAKFTGGFSDDTEIVLGDSYNAACFSRAGANHFYAVLLAR